MSNKPNSVEGLTRHTEPFPESPDAAPETGSGDKVAVVSVGMKRSEMTRLSAIAAENGVTRNNLVAFALRRFIRKYDTGKVRIVKDGPAAEK